MSVLSPPWTRGAVRALVIVAVLLSAFAARVVSSAASELARADALLEAQDVEAAVVHYRRAARWYAPFSPYHVEALDKLARIGARAEQQGQRELALSAYRGVRAAIMSARSFYVPERLRLRAANARIADLMASQPPPPMDAGKSRQQLRAEHLSLLTAEPGPDTFWTFVLLLGFGLWVGAAFALTVRAIDEQDRWIPREVTRWSALIALGFGLFVLGLALA